jgi:Holliday junction resolvase RusA-like endonuclease
MRISSSDPLAARATSAAKAPAQQLVSTLHPALLVLPYPPSENRRIGARAIRVGTRWTAQVYKTAEHKRYLESVVVAAGFIAAPWPKETRLAVSVKLFRPAKRGDIDGPLKALFDALNGRVWADDSQVIELHVTRHDDKQRPRVEVSIHAVSQGENE